MSFIKFLLREFHFSTEDKYELPELSWFLLRTEENLILNIFPGMKNYYNKFACNFFFCSESLSKSGLKTASYKLFLNVIEAR